MKHTSLFKFSCLFVVLAISLVNSEAQIITTFAGNGTMSSGIDGISATACGLIYPFGVATDRSGNVYIADTYGGKVRMINPSGIITTFAGGGSSYGDGGPASSALLNGPMGIANDDSDNIYIADGGDNTIRKVNALGIISTVAGNGSMGFSGDGGPATSAKLNGPIGVSVDYLGQIYIADESNNRIRKVSPSGIITTFAGNGGSSYSGDGAPATSADIHQPVGVAADRHGNVYIPDFFDSRIRKIDTSGIITTFAGNGTGGYTEIGDGGPATDATIVNPTGIGFDDSGNVYIVDMYQNRVRKVNVAGVISTFAGNGGFTDTTDIGVGGFSGDGGPAIDAEFSNPLCVAFDPSGNAYISDNDNYRVRKISVGATSTYVPVVNPEAADVKLFPNPGTTCLSITSTSVITTLSLMNLVGESLFTKTYDINKVTIDVADLPSGIYFIKVNDMVVKKFIKQ